MDSNTYEQISTPTPNNHRDGRLYFTCSETGCENKLTMPEEWENKEVRKAFTKEGWVHMLTNNFCANHAVQAVAAELNLRLHRERGLS